MQKLTAPLATASLAVVGDLLLIGRSGGGTGAGIRQVSAAGGTPSLVLSSVGGQPVNRLQVHDGFLYHLVGQALGRTDLSTAASKGSLGSSFETVRSFRADAAGLAYFATGAISVAGLGGTEPRGVASLATAAVAFTASATHAHVVP